jgi:hypothetical protein
MRRAHFFLLTESVWMIAPPKCSYTSIPRFILFLFFRVFPCSSVCFRGFRGYSWATLENNSHPAGLARGCIPPIEQIPALP